MGGIEIGFGSWSYANRSVHGIGVGVLLEPGWGTPLWQGDALGNWRGSNEGVRCSCEGDADVGWRWSSSFVEWCEWRKWLVLCLAAANSFDAWPVQSLFAPQAHRRAKENAERAAFTQRRCAAAALPAGWLLMADHMWQPGYACSSSLHPLPSTRQAVQQREHPHCRSHPAPALPLCRRQEEAQRQAFREHAEAESRRILEEQKKQDAEWRAAVAEVGGGSSSGSSSGGGSSSSSSSWVAWPRVQHTHAC